MEYILAIRQPFFLKAYSRLMIKVLWFKREHYSHGFMFCVWVAEAWGGYGEGLGGGEEDEGRKGEELRWFGSD